MGTRDFPQSRAMNYVHSGLILVIIYSVPTICLEQLYLLILSSEGLKLFMRPS